MHACFAFGYRQNASSFPPAQKDGVKFRPSSSRSLTSIWLCTIPPTRSYQAGGRSVFSPSLSQIQHHSTVSFILVFVRLVYPPSPPPPLIPPPNHLLNSTSSHMLEPPARRGDGDGLVHDPFADVEVGVDPFLDVFVVGDLVGVETGAGAQMGFVSPVVSWGRGGGCVMSGERVRAVCVGCVVCDRVQGKMGRLTSNPWTSSFPQE
jgi:hypothetical protein